MVISVIPYHRIKRKGNSNKRCHQGCNVSLEWKNSILVSLHVETSKLHLHLQLYSDYNHTDYNKKPANIYIHNYISVSLNAIFQKWLNLWKTKSEKWPLKVINAKQNQNLLVLLAKNLNSLCKLLSIKQKNALVIITERAVVFTGGLCTSMKEQAPQKEVWPAREERGPKWHCGDCSDHDHPETGWSRQRERTESTFLHFSGCVLAVLKSCQVVKILRSWERHLQILAC